MPSESAEHMRIEGIMILLFNFRDLRKKDSNSLVIHTILSDIFMADQNNIGL